jgi:hypothetical protein
MAVYRRGQGMVVVLVVVVVTAGPYLAMVPITTAGPVGSQLSLSMLAMPEK